MTARDNTRPKAASGATDFDPARIASPMLRRLHDAWRTAAGTRAMPSAADLPPQAIDWARDFLSVHDVLPDGEFHFRIDAPHTANIFGNDMTGKPLSAYGDPKVRELIRRTLVRVVETRAPVLEMRDIAVSLWRWEYEILLVPLSADGRNVDTVYSLPQIGSEIRR
ncbi:MAG: PAS domain-containing protein [Rhodospirillales bacterium]|nr:PAS domain-containing protein [Rhodospirillales bacterium]